MKKSVRKTPICFLLLAAMVFSCFYGNYISTSAASAKKKIIMKQSKIRLNPGGRFQLKVKKVMPAKTGKSVNFKSRNKKVVTVSKRGLVTAKKTGTTKIDVVSKKNKSIKTTVTVTVQAKKKDDKTSGAVNSPSVQKSESSAAPTVTPTTTPAATATATPTAPAATQTPPSQEQPSEVPDPTETFNTLPEVYSDIISKEFSLMVSAGTVDWVALDLSECKDMSDSDKQSLAAFISETYGKEAVIKTSDELKKEGSIVTDNVYGFVVQGGVLITICESEKEASKVSFEIDCMANGLTGKSFADCTASIQNDKWVYKLGGKIQA